MDFSKIEPLAELSINGVDDTIARSLASLGYGDPNTSALSASECGDRLVAAADYCELGSGLLADHRVFFDGEPPRGLAAIRTRLERMVHARQNSEVIEAVLKAASRFGPELGSTFLGAGRQGRRRDRHKLVKSLPTLAGTLARLQSSDPDLVSALLAGRLQQALALLPDGKSLITVCEMAVMWSLHDLQIVAARLHRSIWAATDGFLEKPGTKAMINGSISAPTRDMRRALNVVRARLKRGSRVMNAFEQREWNWFVSFAALHGLDGAARDHGRALGLTDAQLDGEGVSNDKLLAVIADLLDQKASTVDRVGSLMDFVDTAFVTAPAAIAQWELAVDEERDFDMQRLEPKKLHKQPISQVSSGMGTVEAMAYAVTCFVKRMESLEKTIVRAHRAVREGTKFIAPLDMSKPDAAQRQTISALMQVYRGSILRDDDHLDDKPPKVCKDGLIADQPLLLSAVGTYWSCEYPLLPHPDRALEREDIILGRGIALSDKIHNLDVFDKKRSARAACEAAEVLIRRRSVDRCLDLSLPLRLGDSRG